MKSQCSAPKPDFVQLEYQSPSLPDDGISQDSKKSLDCVYEVTLKVRYDKFGNLIDKKKRKQQVSFRDRIEKTQKLYDLIVYDHFNIEQAHKNKQQQIRQNQQLCCKIQ